MKMELPSTKKDRVRSCVLFLIQKRYTSYQQFDEVYNKSIHRFRVGLSKTQVYNEYLKLCQENPARKNPEMELYCVSKTTRSDAGVCVISTIMAPEFTFWTDGQEVKTKFTCKYDCAFCPNDPEQARSYPRDEPVPLRGAQNGFDVVRQAHSRMEVLANLNHPVDKLEWIVLGGTWSSFPREYRHDYHRDIFFAANLWSEGINVWNICQESRDPSSWRKVVKERYGRQVGTIDYEKKLNRKSKCRVIGVTIETRPDEINLDELRFIRDLGCTRIQMGFQHTDNDVLRKNRRGCTVEQCMRGLKLCLDNGFKVDGHWMPDLPFTTVEKDNEMITRAFMDPNLRCDQVKIYPTQVLDFTRIKKWYDEGKYQPYAETDFNKLFELVIYAKTIMPPWVRTNRIVRDFPKKIIRGGLKQSHLHDMVQRELKKRNIGCQCIRCRQLKRQTLEKKDKVCVRKYESAGGQEYFISIEAADVQTGEDKVIGFCRLRLNSFYLDLDQQFPELHDCALIRELHVYGKTTKTGNDYAQHRGIGKRLLAKAEDIAVDHGWPKIAVISGIGVQDYYLAQGYHDGFYMIKYLRPKEYMITINRFVSRLISVFTMY